MIGHLAACLVKLNRVGDDTSGVDWERTRKYGVHALARSSVQQDGMQPLDWMENSCPVRWLVNGQEQRFSWLDEAGTCGFAPTLDARTNG